jgi:DNA-binding MarR family transcriptional regulator
MPAKPKLTSSSPAFMNPRLRPWVLVSEVYWMSYKFLDRRFYDLGVSASQARVLLVLQSAPEPIKPSLVATLLFQETQSITGILHRIESKGWVRRHPDKRDQRAVGLELTSEGRKLAEKVDAISQGVYDDLFGSLTAAEARQVEEALRKVRAVGFKLPETDFKLRRAQQYPIWKD